MYKPFTYKPFLMDPPQEELPPPTEKEEEKDIPAVQSVETALQKLSIKPFVLLDEDMKRTSETIMDAIGPMLDGSVESVERMIQLGVHDSYQPGREKLQILPHYLRPQGVYKKCLNFELFLLQKVIEVRDGVQGEEFIYRYKVKISVLQRSGIPREFVAEVDGAKIKQYDWIREATNSLATNPIEKAQKLAFDNAVQECIETPGVPWKYIYPNAGWREIPGIGYRFVYSGGAIGLNDGKIEVDTKSRNVLQPDWQAIGRPDTFQQAFGMCSICKSRRVSTLLFLFTHAAMLSTLFEISKFSVNFVFGLVGVTNSRKTSMTLEITRILNRDQMKPDGQFTATPGGIEMLLSTYKDAPIFIDDFRPGETRGDQVKLNDNLRNLVRLYGDRVPKKRMKSVGERDFYPIQGAVVLTMEVVTGVMSSVSRMFLAEMDSHEVNNRTLTFYQKNRWILPTHVYDFLSWATGRFSNIVELIAGNAHELRVKYRFSFPRYGEMYAIMYLTASIFAQYALERGFWDQAAQTQFIQEAESIILGNLRTMERKWRGCDKGLLVLKALDFGLRQGRIQPAFLNAESCTDGKTIYGDEAKYYIQTRDLRRLVVEYCNTFAEQTSIINDEEVIGLLERLEVIEIYTDSDGKRQRSRKLPIQRGNTKRYLHILKEQMRKKLEEGDSM